MIILKLCLFTLSGLFLGFQSKALAESTEETYQVFRSAWNANNLADGQLTPHLLAADSLNAILNQRDLPAIKEPNDFFGHIIAQLGRPKEYFTTTQSPQPLIRIQDSSSEEPPLFIIVPGIFGEFIATHPFEETLRNSSPLQKEYLEKIKLLNPKDDNRTDPQLNLLLLKQEMQPLEELVRIGAVLDQDGKVVANTLILHTKLMSLESVGVLRGNSLVFHRRLSKFFAILGRLPSRIAMVGYSRGAINGLDLLSMSQKYKPATWTKHIQAFVSLGGVLYGSELADRAFSKNSSDLPVMTKRLNLLKQTSRALRPVYDDEPNKASLYLKNTLTWTSFLTNFALLELGEALKDRPEDPSELKGYLLNKWSEIKKMIELQADVNLKSLLLVASDIAFASLNLKNFVTDYNKNILRFQLLTREAAIAAESLTTKARLEWWRDNIIPTEGIRYFSVAASLIRPEEELGLSSDFSYNRQSPDYLSLLKSFLEFDQDLKIPLNDSQVGVHKAVFWPQLAPLLNPQQAPYAAIHLGVFQTHHWGLTLESVTPMNDSSKEPFPRVNLLKTLTQTIFIDQQSQFNQQRPASEE